MTPPKLRMGNYRSKYLKKRQIEELEESETSFKEEGFDYFEYLNGKMVPSNQNSA